MTMKKITSLILVTALLMLWALPIGAIDQDDLSQDVDVFHTVGNSISSDGGSQDVDVYHTVTGGYLITIPETIVVAKTGETAATLEVAEVKVGGELTVSVSSANYDNGWQLTARGATLEYSIKADGAEVANNGAVLTCPSGTQYMKKDIAFSVIGTDVKSVSYTDTLTFTVSVNG
jgi:hypothetical protein